MAEARIAWVERWRTALSDAPANVRLEALLEGPDSMALIRSLPAEDLYVVIREVGLADAAGVIARCTGAQVQSFLDLDVWRGDRFDAKRYAPWILALRRGGCRDLPKILAQLDPEVQALALKQLIAVQELEEDEDPDPIGVFVMDTPDRRYRVSALSDDETMLELIRTQLGATLARGPLHLSAYLSQVSWELSAQLEEQAGQFRRGRMQDLGFPDPEEAPILEAPLPSVEAALALAGGPVAREPDSAFRRALVARGGRELLTRALAAIPDATLAARAAQDLVHLCNGLMVLRGVDPGEPEEVREATGQAMSMVELTLRRVAGEDVAAAAACLSRSPGRTLYRVAVTLLHGPRTQALALTPLIHRLPDEDEPFLQALAGRPPLQADGRPFSDPQQVELAAGRVAGLEELAGWLAGAPEPVSALQAYGSAVIRKHLGLGDDAAPVTRAQLERFLREGDDSLLGQGLGDTRLRGEWEGLWGRSEPGVRFVGGAWLKEEAPS